MKASFDDHDMDVQERLSRMEGKIDFIIKSHEEQQNHDVAQWKKLDNHQQRLHTIEIERRIWWRVITPLLSLISGAIGAIFPYLFFTKKE